MDFVITKNKTTMKKQPRLFTDRYLKIVLTVIACNLTLLTLKDWVLPLRAADDVATALPCARQEEILPIRLQEVDPLAFRNIFEALPVEVRTNGTYDAIPVHVVNKVTLSD